jgi:hypothetical protein
MKVTTILLCVFLCAAANPALAQIPKAKETHPPSSENIPDKLPPGIDLIRCPEWLTLSFDTSKTPEGWFAYQTYKTRATKSVVGQGKPGKEVLLCYYGEARLEREVPANKCKVYVEKDARWKSFQCTH